MPETKILKTKMPKTKKYRKKRSLKNKIKNTKNKTQKILKGGFSVIRFLLLILMLSTSKVVGLNTTNEKEPEQQIVMGLQKIIYNPNNLISQYKSILHELIKDEYPNIPNITNNYGLIKNYNNTSALSLNNVTSNVTISIDATNINNFVKSLIDMASLLRKKDITFEQYSTMINNLSSNKDVVNLLKSIENDNVDKLIRLNSTDHSNNEKYLFKIIELLYDHNAHNAKIEHGKILSVFSRTDTSDIDYFKIYINISNELSKFFTFNNQLKPYDTFAYNQLATSSEGVSIARGDAITNYGKALYDIMAQKLYDIMSKLESPISKTPENQKEINKLFDELIDIGKDNVDSKIEEIFKTDNWIYTIIDMINKLCKNNSGLNLCNNPTILSILFIVILFVALFIAKKQKPITNDLQEIVPVPVSATEPDSVPVSVTDPEPETVPDPINQILKKDIEDVFIDYLINLFDLDNLEEEENYTNNNFELPEVPEVPELLNLQFNYDKEITPNEFNDMSDIMKKYIEYEKKKKILELMKKKILNDIYKNDDDKKNKYKQYKKIQTHITKLGEELKKYINEKPQDYIELVNNKSEYIKVVKNPRYTYFKAIEFVNHILSK